MYQGSTVEATVVQKLNQGVPGNCGNYSPAAFCVTFFRKKVTTKITGSIELNGRPPARTMFSWTGVNGAQLIFRRAAASDTLFYIYYKYSRCDAPFYRSLINIRLHNMSLAEAAGAIAGL